MVENKSILLIGKTGSGKSTLANVIVGSHKFEEGEGATSKTKEVKIETTEVDGVEYRVIDTVGVADTGLTEGEILEKLNSAVRVAKESSSQILLFFLTGSGKFTEEEEKTYKLLKDKELTKHAVIVRTHFPRFFNVKKKEKNKEKCEEERRAMLKNNGKFFKEIIEGCEVVFVDNPSVTDEDSKVQNERRRKFSKDILEEYLKNVCQDKREEENIQVPPKNS